MLLLIRTSRILMSSSFQSKLRSIKGKQRFLRLTLRSRNRVVQKRRSQVITSKIQIMQQLLILKEKLLKMKQEKSIQSEDLHSIKAHSKELPEAGHKCKVFQACSNQVLLQVTSCLLFQRRKRDLTSRMRMMYQLILLFVHLM